MKAGYTHISMVLDRSGSMHSCKDDAEGGLNRFIEDQKQADGEATLTLAQFDDKYELVYDGIPIKDAQKVPLVPRGMTALYDAVGKTIVTTGEFLKLKSEDERPEHVIFVIVTDGHENSSKEFPHQRIKEMIEHQTKTYQWEFVYLGATLDAVQVAVSMGIPDVAALANSARRYGETYTVASANVKALRSNKVRKIGFSEEERNKVK